MRSMSGWVWPIGMLLAAACGGDDSRGPGPGAETGPVMVGDNFFQPADVMVTRAGSAAEVVWNWTGGNQHNVTFDAGPPHSQTQTSGSFSRSFSEAGAFTYICTIHGRAVMSGTVTVE